MPDQFEVGLEGMAQLRAALRETAGNLDDLKAANKRAAEIIATEARIHAPRRSGKLAATIRTANQANRARVNLGSAAVPYAGPIHWGWESRHIPRNAFVYEAAKNTQPVWLPAYEDDIQQLLDKVRGA